MDSKTDHLFFEDQLSHPENSPLFSLEIERWKKYYASETREFLEGYKPDEKESVERFITVYGLPPYSQNGIYSSIKRKDFLDLDQFVWNLFSHETVEAVARILKKFKTLEKSALIPCLKTLITNLGSHRYQAGQILKHHETSQVKLAFFGQLRTQDTNELWESVYQASTTHPWTDISATVYAKVMENIHRFNPGHCPPRYAHIDEYRDSWNFRIKVYYYQFEKGKLQPTEMRFIHPAMSKELEERIYDRLADCFLDKHDVSATCGKLAHMLCRHPLTRRGGASITDWFIRGFAKNEGVSFRERNDAPLTYDWMAFLGFDESEFIEWFSKEAYANPKIMNAPLLSAEKESGNRPVNLFSF